MMNIYGLFVVLVGLANAKTIVTENEYFPGNEKEIHIYLLLCYAISINYDAIEFGNWI